MSISRRDFLKVLGAAPAVAAVGGYSPALYAADFNLKLSHQFPGGTINEGDFRDRLCRKFAAEVAKRSGGTLTSTVYPGSSLMKVNAQFSALRKGALDMTLVPLNYAGGEVPETNIGLMPGLVTSYKQGMAWKNAEIGKALTKVLSDKGVLVVSWIWQAGGVASRSVPIINPEDTKGLKVRGGSREMDMVLKAAGASVLTMPSNEIYAGMQTGALDAAMTSSTSLMSFRLEEVAKALTTGRGKTYWFMFEPLLISKEIFDKMDATQQGIIMKVGAELEKFATEAAMADDVAVAKAYTKAGGKAYDMNQASLDKWVSIARETAWKDFGGKNPSCANLLQLALQVPA
ncbi:MAG: TRAP transporter substrate-binding protein DctP [Fluviibacter sp.]